MISSVIDSRHILGPRGLTAQSHVESMEFNVWWPKTTFDDFSHDHRRIQSESAIISNYLQKLTSKISKSRLLVFKHN